MPFGMYNALVESRDAVSDGGLWPGEGVIWGPNPHPETYNCFFMIYQVASIVDQRFYLLPGPVSTWMGESVQGM